MKFDLLTLAVAGALALVSLPSFAQVNPGTKPQFSYYGTTGSVVSPMALSDLLNGPNVNNVVAYGADPTGATSSVSAFGSAISAALAGPTGGVVYMPCGKYSFTGTVNVTIPANKVFTLVGGGPDCTVVSSASGGTPFHIAKADTTGSFHLRDFTVAATAPNSGDGIILDIVGPLTTSSVMNDVTNVTLRGSTSVIEDVNYFQIGIRVIGVSGINFTNITEQGDLAGAGIGVSLDSNASGAAGIAYYFTNCNFFHGGTGVAYGNLIQGVQFTNSDFTGNQVGIQTPAGSSGLFELAISSTQFQNILADISLLSTVSDINISSSEFGPYMANSGFCSICGKLTNAAIIGNTFVNGTGATGNAGVDITNGDANVVSGNSFAGPWAFGIVSATGGAVTNTNIQANVYGSSVTTKVSPASSSGSISVGVATP